jgi:predicted HicB family RNase H-like nuclease
MTGKPMTPDEEFDFYAQPENQEPQGPARRRRASRLGPPVPVRFPPELLEQARRAADADDRSLSAWIRRAVEHELARTA